MVDYKGEKNYGPQPAIPQKLIQCLAFCQSDQNSSPTGGRKCCHRLEMTKMAAHCSQQDAQKRCKLGKKALPGTTQTILMTILVANFLITTRPHEHSMLCASMLCASAGLVAVHRTIPDDHSVCIVTCHAYPCRLIV